MKHVYIRFLLYTLLFLPGDLFSIEGFAAGTLVKVPHGYATIENLSVGDYVICYDTDKNLTKSKILYCAKKGVDKYIHLKISHEYIDIACDQQFYDAKINSWVTAEYLSDYDIIELIEEPIDVYIIGVEKYHNFFVSADDICVHNFFPPIVLAISLAFGSGACEITGASLGIAGLGTYLGWKWHKRNKQHKFTISPISFDRTLEPNGIYDIEDAQAPGKTTEKEGYHPPKKWDGKKKKHPITGAVGWPDKKGKIWVPTGPNGHGGSHWDVQHPNGRDYENVYPGGKIR